MPVFTRPPVDPFGILPRLARFLTGLAVLAGFLTGAAAAPQIQELTQAQIEARLAESGGPLGGFIKTLEKAMVTGTIEDAELLVNRDAILTRATQRFSF